MPKILINERDKTSSGSVGNYANYSVLITGFALDPAAIEALAAKENVKYEPVTPDTNGVYEFSSVKDFKWAVGMVQPNLTVQYEGANGSEESTIYHYGNQMAYELLNMGYSVVFKPIATVNFTKSTAGKNYVTSIKLPGEASTETNTPALSKLVSAAAKLANDTFWEIFKDKASYDFRFVSHGLLRGIAYTTEVADAAKALVDLYIGRDKLDEINKDALKQVGTKEEWEASHSAPGTTDPEPTPEPEPEPDPEPTPEPEPEPDPEPTPEPEPAAYSLRNTPVQETTYEFALADKQEELFTAAKSSTKYPAFDNYASYAAAAKPKSELSGIAYEISVHEATVNAFNTANITTSTINKANGCIANLAKYKALAENDMYSRATPGRGDCIALIELAENEYTEVSAAANATQRPEELIIAAINKMTDISGDTDKGTFCAMTVPSVVYKMTDTTDFENNKKFPGAFHYLACFINSLKTGFNEWYAAAGYTRGVSGFTIDYTTVKLGEIAVNALEPRNIKDQNQDPKFACNVIANFRGNYYLWGNRTAHNLGDANASTNNDLEASHFLNIRQLCTTIKKQLYVACRRFTFDPNSDTLWFNFVNAIKPTLETMKADQGIRDYKVIKVPIDKKAMLKAKIRIIPIEAIEDFDIEVSLEDSFGETVVTTA